MNLNGEWEFEFDDDRVGESERWYDSESDHTFSQKIQVPFCYESKLSGIGDTTQHDVVWYRRSVQIPENYQNQQIILHFGAVDYRADVWVNGVLVTTHIGGHVPFSADVTNELQKGENVIVVRAEDYARDIDLPRGKQYWKDQSESIFYTRTTGIWQTVWLEPVSEVHLKQVKITPDLDQNTIDVRSFINGLEQMNEDRKSVV